MIKRLNRKITYIILSVTLMCSYAYADAYWHEGGSIGTTTNPAKYTSPNKYNLYITLGGNTAIYSKIFRKELYENSEGRTEVTHPKEIFHGGYGYNASIGWNVTPYTAIDIKYLSVTSSEATKDSSVNALVLRYGFNWNLSRRNGILGKAGVGYGSTEFTNTNPNSSVLYDGTYSGSNVMLNVELGYAFNFTDYFALQLDYNALLTLPTSKVSTYYAGHSGNPAYMTDIYTSHMSHIIGLSLKFNFFKYRDQSEDVNDQLESRKSRLYNKV